MPEVVTIETPALGDRSYLIHDGAEAVVVDSQRDIGRILATVEARRVRITHVLETHIHNDYVTGGLALASQTGASYVVAASEEVSFDRLAISDKDQIITGSLTMTAIPRVRQLLLGHADDRHLVHHRDRAGGQRGAAE